VNIRTWKKSGPRKKPKCRVLPRSSRKIEQARQELEVARRSGNLNRMAELQYGIIPDLERSLQMVDEHSKREPVAAQQGDRRRNR
jgi:hypothetical protein